MVKHLGVHPVILDCCSNLLRFVLLAPLVLRNRDQARLRADSDEAGRVLRFQAGQHSNLKPTTVPI